MTAKVLFIDIETSPNLGWTWGKWEQNVLDSERDWQVLCYAYAWNDGPVKVSSLRGAGPFADDTPLVMEMIELLEQADMVVAHNGDQFDLPKIYARGVILDLPPVDRPTQYDTKKAAKRVGKFTSNSLNDLGRYFGVGQKVPHTGFDMWLGCMNDSEADWKLMEKYNKMDVQLLRDVYKRMAPHDHNHPNLTHLAGESVEDQLTCPFCGGTHGHFRGYKATKVTLFRKWQCQGCGKYSRLRLGDKSFAKPELV